MLTRSSPRRAECVDAPGRCASRDWCADVSDGREASSSGFPSIAFVIDAVLDDEADASRSETRRQRGAPWIDDAMSCWYKFQANLKSNTLGGWGGRVVVIARFVVVLCLRISQRTG